MGRGRSCAAAAVLAVAVAPAVVVGPAAGGSGVASVLVAGDSLPHQAMDEIRAELARRGYDDVHFEVHGGTTVEWALQHVEDADEDIVVLATGANNALGGWTADDARAAASAVAALERAPCGIWVLPGAARYPSGREVPDPDAAAALRGIRSAVAGRDVHVADWAEVADAVPEIHGWDGVHHTPGGELLYAELVAGAVTGTCSPIDPATTVAHTRYVDAVHRILLGQDPDDATRQRWTWRLDHGHPRLAFARRLGASPAWIDRQITELYQVALGRDPDPDGLIHWRARLVAGDPLAAVAAHAHGSDEARARAGGTDEALVRALYRGLLHREGDAPGVRFWVDHLAAGAPAALVAAELHGSLESRRDRVRRLYRSILDREPDAGGLAHWAGALVTVGDLRLAATLVASDELYRRATATA